jgi:hypothetical protein
LGIHNLANYPLTKDQTTALSLGLEFIPAPKFDPNFNKYIRNQFNTFARSVRTKYYFHRQQNDKPMDFLTVPNKNSVWNPPSAPSSIEHYLSHVKKRIEIQIYKLAKQKRKILSYSTPTWLIKALNDIKVNNDIIITNADKNMGVSVVLTSDYIKEGLRQLNDTTVYTRVKLDNLKTSQTIRQAWSTLRNTLFKYQQLYIMANGKTVIKNNKPQLTKLATFLMQLESTDELQLASFYMLMKVHKTPITGRPIVSSINSLTYHTSRYIDNQLQPMLKYISSYIQSSQQLVAHLEQSTAFPHDCTILCADIDSLYPNIPITEGLIFFKRSLIYHKQRHLLEFSNLSIDLICDLMNWVLNNNYFTFGPLCFKQRYGTAMGTPAAVVFACLFLDEVEREVLQRLSFRPIFFKRYIDDIFGIFANRDNALTYIQTFNSILKTIHCSSYTIDDKEGVFLDLTIFKGTRFHAMQRFDIKVFQKPQNKYLYLPPNSFHSKSVYTAFISAELDRYRTYCNNDADYIDIRDKFHERLVARGYTKEFLEPIFKEEERSRSKLLTKLFERFTPGSGKKKEKAAVPPLMFKTINTPQSMQMNMSKCLKLTVSAKEEPNAAKFFQNRAPIKCLSNPASIGSFFGRSRKTLHSFDMEKVLSSSTNS